MSTIPHSRPALHPSPPFPALPSPPSLPSFSGPSGVLAFPLSVLRMLMVLSTLSTLSMLAALPALATQPTGPGTETFDHRDWTTVLQRFVDERGRVDYRGLAEDRAVFDRYIERIETVGPSSRPDLFPTRDHALAYYLNAYNAQVFAGVLSRGPEEKSVWSGLVSGLNFFGRMRITVDGEKMNLNRLENELIREGFRDPRIHAALNCASIGCPPLPRTAFEAEGLQQRLDEVMAAWVNDPAHCAVDPAARRVDLNKIFDWFDDDFLDYERSRGVEDPNLVDYLNRYLENTIPRDYEVRFLPYDKDINKQ